MTNVNDDLTIFATLLMNVIGTHPDLPYNLSGVARILEVGGNTFFSASLVNKDVNASIVSPDDFVSKFQNLNVPGFTFKSVEVLTFAATFKVPLPAWRLQVKFLKV
ncbi:hypothetical protein ABEL47_22790 [Escherichia coli]